MCSRDTLVNYNRQLVSCIDELQQKRAIVIKDIAKKESEMEHLVTEIASLQDKFTKVKTSLVQCNAAKKQYDQNITETEAAYMKILESSQTLLKVLKQEGTINLDPTKQPQQPQQQQQQLQQPQHLGKRR